MTGSVCQVVTRSSEFLFFFFFNDPATPEIYPLSLHDALPISRSGATASSSGSRPSARSTRTGGSGALTGDRKSTRLNSSHLVISYAVFCLKKKKTKTPRHLTLPTPPTARRRAPSHDAASGPCD